MKQMNAIVNVLGYKSHKSLLIKSAPAILIYEKIRNVVCVLMSPVVISAGNCNELYICRNFCKSVHRVTFSPVLHLMALLVAHSSSDTGL